MQENRSTLSDIMNCHLLLLKIQNKVLIIKCRNEKDLARILIKRQEKRRMQIELDVPRSSLD